MMQQPGMSPGMTMAAGPVVIMPQPMLSEMPMQVTCGNCHHTVTTTIIKENGACAYIASLFTCLICPLCFWVPLVMESYKDTHHSCPSCGAMLGSRRRT